MPSLDWRRHRPKGGTLSVSDSSADTTWDEGWDVIEYVPPAGTPAWPGLLADKPELSPGRLHDPITSAYVTNFKADPLGLKGWRVIVSYRIGDPKELDLPPTDRALELEVETETSEVPTTRQWDGTPWLSTAGGLIGGITKPQDHVLLRCSKNVAAVPAWFLAFAGSAVNTDPLNIKGLTVSPGYGMLKDRKAGKLTKEQVNGINYLFYPISFTIDYNPETWLTRVYNRDLYQINDEGDLVPCVDSEGEPTAEPCFLDAAGKQLPFPVNPASIITLEGWNVPRFNFSTAIPLA